MAVKEIPQAVLDLVRHLEQSGTGKEKLAVIKDLGRDSENAEAFLENAAKVLPEGTMRKIHDFIDGVRTKDPTPARGAMAGVRGPALGPDGRPLANAPYPDPGPPYTASGTPIYSTPDPRKSRSKGGKTKDGKEEFGFDDVEQSNESRAREYVNNPNKNPTLETRDFLARLQDYFVKDRGMSIQKAGLLIGHYPAIVGVGLTTGDIVKTATELEEADLLETEKARETGANPTASIAPDQELVIAKEKEEKEAKEKAEKAKRDAEDKAKKERDTKRGVTPPDTTTSDTEDTVDDDETDESEEDHSHAGSSVRDMSADEAIARIGRMTSVPKLEDITGDNNERVTVRKAASDRLDALKSK